LTGIHDCHRLFAGANPMTIGREYADKTALELGQSIRQNENVLEAGR
jgi:hypothetical protein